MPHYPDKLLIMFPIYRPVEYRRRLVAIDDALVVHRRPDGEYLLELRRMVKLSPRGRSSYANTLLQLAADVQASYTIVIVDRDRFLEDLETLARDHATAKDRDAIERAVQVIVERARYQIQDHLDTDEPHSEFGRALIASRERRTKATPGESNGLNCRHGVPTPRAEQLWHVIRYELVDVRSQQRGMAAWERWCRRNRPDMPGKGAD